MSLKNSIWTLLLLWIVAMGVNLHALAMHPHRILLDTDVDTDDLFALLYLLKLSRAEFDLKAVTINANSWTDAGHSVNQIYDILFMMGRDDIPVGVGGEGGVSEDGTIHPNVGGYLPIIDQGMTTAGYCRYRQAIPVGLRGRLDIDSNFGIRKQFLPQGHRQYSPLQQPTAQQVMIDVISEGPTNVFITGAHTNFALFLMSNPHLKKNVEHLYIMGGSIRSKNPTSHCSKNARSACYSQESSDPGNVFTDYTSNPYAEYNMFVDPFAAYQVIHSGIPVTLVPLDATNTIPVTKQFFEEFEQSQRTHEAQYCFKSLKMVHDTWLGESFYTSYFMWDSFTAGVALSSMSNTHKTNGENEFAEMEYMNITVVTSDKPYGKRNSQSDGSNPFFDGHKNPMFHLNRRGVHSGHVQMALRDPFCLVKKGKGRCKDGYTEEITGPESVRVLVATKAKPSKDSKSPLDKEFFRSFLDVLNRPQQSGRFNFTTQFRYYKEMYYKVDFGTKKLGKPVIFDMDMSAGDFLALLYLLKVPVEVLNLKAIFVTPTGWANAATIDVVYDMLHMMGRDDIPVGLGDVFAMNQSDPLFSAVGDCKYVKAIPHGSGGFLDSDTLFGLARDLPRSPRRYTAENSVKYGASSDTDHPQLRQRLALEVWEDITRTINAKAKITVLTNGPLTTLGKLILSDNNASSLIQDVFMVGGHINHGTTDNGNLFTIPSNKYAEFNTFLDPLAAKTVFDFKLDITLIPWGTQRKVTSFSKILERLYLTKKTPEVLFAQRLLSRLQKLQKKHSRYQHMDIFLGEILGAVISATNCTNDLNTTLNVKPVRVFATGTESIDGQLVIDEKQGRPITILEKVDHIAFYEQFANRLGDEKQSAVIGSFFEQKRRWNTEKITPYHDKLIHLPDKRGG